MPSRHATGWIVSGLAIVAVVVCSGRARADVIELKSGGRVEGELVGGEAGSDGTYTITTPAGGHVTIPQSEVARVVAESSDDSQAQEAEKASDDKEPTQEEIMAARGMVMYKGRWRTPQHVALLKAAEEADERQGHWNRQLKRWRRWLDSRRQERVDEALAEFRALRDPDAAPALVDMLREEENVHVRRVLVEAAAEIDHRLTTEALVELSLLEPAGELRYRALELAIEAGGPGVVRRYMRALKNANNVIVNRAAEALGMLGNRDAIGPLIEALVTEHKVRVDNQSSGQYAFSFSPSGGTAMSFGDKGPQIVERKVENRAVLEALVQLAGGTSFGYNQQQWREWLTSQAKAKVIDLRRDR